MSKITNITGVGLPLAVWLAGDDYDFNPVDKSISATALMKPARQILLAERITPEQIKPIDVIDRLKSRMGHAIHDSVEKVWYRDYTAPLKALGYSDSVIERIRVNPKPEELTDDTIPIYLERRNSRTHRGYKISGKFDQAINGELHDIKTTSAYTYKYSSNDQKYIEQGSLYRWIHQDILTSDHINIEFVFTDWKAADAVRDKTYPQSPVLQKKYPLMSLKKTEAWIDNKLNVLEHNATLPETQLVPCPDDELWRDETKWKYFSDPAKAADPTARSTKNFTDKAEAHKHLSEKGKGIIVEVPGKVRRCGYCPAFPICSQKDQYEHA